MTAQRYWPFMLVCLGYAVIVFVLVLRRRLALQASFFYLFILALLGLAPVALPWSPRFVHALGFVLPSNLFFAVAIGGLSLLHLASLVTQSELEARSIALVQELALLEERLDRGGRRASAS